MEKEKLKKLVIEEFGGKNAIEQYSKLAKRGFWDGEEYLILKYFENKRGEVLDLGCGTGRTTMPLVEKGYIVVAVDIVPEMINTAKKIAKQKNKEIDYRIGDATELKFDNDSFDYLLFSNQGWTQIPCERERLKALKEMRRVLKKDGICIFTAHPRVWFSKYLFFWIWQWVKFYILKPVGFKIEEIDFGDRFFTRETKDINRTYVTKQYIHIPSIKKTKELISLSGLDLIEVNNNFQISKEDIRKHPPVFYVCRK